MENSNSIIRNITPFGKRTREKKAIYDHANLLKNASRPPEGFQSVKNGSYFWQNVLFVILLVLVILAAVSIYFCGWKGLGYFILAIASFIGFICWV